MKLRVRGSEGDAVIPWEEVKLREALSSSTDRALRAIAWIQMRDGL